jgi:hypothetical protein
MPSGLEVSGSPITASGELAVVYASGFQAFTTAEANKLATVASGAQANEPTNLTYSGDTRFLGSSTGSGVTIPLVSTSSAGLAPATGEPSGKYLKDDGTWATVEAGASPAGSGTEIQYRDGSALGAIPNSSVDGATGAVTLARLILAANGAASTPPMGLTGTWFTGGTATTTKPALLIEPTGTASTAWSTSGTGLGVNAPSGFAGNLLDLQVNGKSRASYDASTQTFRIASGTGGGGGGAIHFTNDGVSISRLSNALLLRSVNSNVPVRVVNDFFQINDVNLFRDAADTLAQRRAISAQAFRVYNTFTSATNFERAKIQWASNILHIGTEKGADGGTARDMELQTDGVTRITVKADGAILFSGIPASDPSVAGQLWNDGGTLKISAG